MQRDEVVSFPVRPRSIDDPFSYILSLARGKRVLNVGASGGVEHYLPDHQEAWLHRRLSSVAQETVGIDIDYDSIAYAASQGVKIQYGDCESIRFERPFDLIVMSDVIEHVSAPLRAIDNLAGQLTSRGQLVITTPNATHYGLVGRAWLSGSASVYYDHVMAFLPEHFQAICHRLDLRLADVAFFSHFDGRTATNRVKSLLGRMLGKLIPRSHSTFLVVLEPQSHGVANASPRQQTASR